ncbi:MAG: hypothetical protein ABI665_14210 [Vicinamibacterales bacterium]
MPVFKFRSVEAMNQPHWRTPGDPALFAAIAELWSSGARMQNRRFPPGVHRYRSIEELDAQVEAWHRAHVDKRAAERDER